MSSIVDSKKYRKSKYKLVVANHKVIDGSYSFLAETNAIVLRAKQLGYTIPTFTTLVAINNYIQNMKNTGVWDKLDIYLEFSYNSTLYADFSLINWKNPNWSLATKSGGVTYQTNGWKGNGIDGVINTNINPNMAYGGPILNYLQNNASRILTVSESGVSSLDGYAAGAANVRLNNANTTSHRMNSNTSLTANFDMAGTGLKAITRSSSSDISLTNMSTAASLINTSVTFPSNTNATFCLLLNTTTQYGNSTISNYGVGGYLTNSEIQSMRTIYNQYLTKVGLTALA